MKEQTKLKIKPDLYPLSGYSYSDPDGVKHLANNLRGLVKSVSAYRVRVGRALGDPEQDILKQLCARQPKLCTEYVPAHDAGALTRIVASNAAFVFSQKTFEKVPAAEASLRAETCLRCRSNVSWGADCPPCLKNADDMISKMLEKLPKNKALKNRACLHALDDLQLAVWKTEGKPVLNPPPGSNCWREMLP